MTRRATLWALRLGLGAVFVAAGVLKLADPATFAGEIQNYRLLPEIAPFLAAIVPGVELVVGLALLLGSARWLRAAALVAGGMLGVFTLAVASVVVRGIDVTCGCFGAGSGPVTLTTVARDVGFVAAAIVLLLLTHDAAPSTQRATTSVA